VAVLRTITAAERLSGRAARVRWQAVALIDGKVPTEASGNVTMATVGDIGGTGVTYISSGALTHSVTALDISFNIET
jgi:nicotinate-nucleotide pyrophosphorylase (carboxylating)